MKTKHDLLIIDDEDIVMKGVTRICRGEGLEVDTVDSATAGLDRLAECAYRLVFCDIMMEGLDGFAFLEEAARRGVRVPVIMMTGYSTMENAVRSLQCGAIDFIAKPFTADEVLAVLHRGLSFSRIAAGQEPLPATPAVAHKLGYVSWAALEPEGLVRIGMSKPYVHTVGGLRGLSLHAVGDDLVQGSSCASVQAGDGLVHELMCPVSGRVLEVNPQAAADTVAEDPHGAGWLYRVVPSDLEYNLKWLAPPEAPVGARKQGELT